MLDRFILKAERKRHYFVMILIAFFISVVISYINYLIGGNSIFAVALISLALSYPITTYVREMDRLEIEEYHENKSFLNRYSKELVLFWAIFLGVFVGLFVSTPFTYDFSYQEKFVESGIAGNIVFGGSGFFEILFNNLKVNLFTFVISFFVFSGLIFILVWNASILAYYVSTFESFDKIFLISFLLLPHGLLEVGGYIFAGIAGAIFAYRLDLAYSNKFYRVFTDEGKRKYLPDRRHTFKKLINKKFFKDFSYLILFSVLLIVVGAIVETL